MAFSCFKPANTVIGVADFVLRDEGLAIVGLENQILFQNLGAALPARG